MKLKTGGRTIPFALGFDDVSIVPSGTTMDPEDVSTDFRLGNHVFSIPFIASAMDGVVDVRFAVEMGKLGGLAVLNLHGLQTRYEDPGEQIERIIAAGAADATPLIQSVYKSEIKEDLVIKRIREMKKGKIVCAVSSVPQDAERFGEVAEDAGADVFVVQSTVTSVRHVSSRRKALDLKKLCRRLKIPVVAGNCVGRRVVRDLMDAGAAGVLVGVGPGAACTTRGVLGIGAPQVTATLEAAAARDEFHKATRRYVPVITDGGMSTGGEVVKAFASGADAVMLGAIFAKSREAPGKGFHWGMATSHEALPRGTRIHVGVRGALKNILAGPAEVDDGTQNLVGCLKSAMGVCGAKNIRAFHRVELVASTSFMTEGKAYQFAQKTGMGR
ncbi:MAG: GuaB3 family IMP dehydrogenase-related protein [bacterium]